MPGLGESRSATPRRCAASLPPRRIPERRLDRRQRGERVDLLRAWRSPGGPGPPPARAARAPAPGRRDRRQLTRHRGRQRPHPVLLERLLGAQHVGGRHPPFGPSRSPAANVAAARVPCARRTAMLFAPARAIPTACSSSGHDLVGSSAAEVPRRSECRQRHGPPGRSGRLSSSTASAPSCLGGSEIAGPVGQVARSIATLDATVAPPSSSGRPSSAAAVASAHRSAAACSPESQASQARARHSRGSLVTSSSGRASSQRTTVALRPRCSAPFHDAAIRSAASASWPAASRWLDGRRDVARRGKPGTRRARAARACTPPSCPRARGAGPRGRRGGSETTRGARQAGRERGWPARSARAAPSSVRRRAPHRRAAHRSGRARRCRPGTPRPAGSWADRTSSPR